MYKFLFLIVSCGITTIGMSQDLIKKRDKTTIEAKIVEVHEAKIHYKKSTNLEGPIYVIETVKISSIIYQNGTTEEFNNQEYTSNIENQAVLPLNDDKIYFYGPPFFYKGKKINNIKMKKLLFSQGNIEAIKIWNEYKTAKVLAYLTGYVSIPLVYIMLGGLFSVNPLTRAVLGGGGAVLSSLSITGHYVLKSMYREKRIKALELYNKDLEALEQFKEGYY